jgi:SAM-dependent methyltransferase
MGYRERAPDGTPQAYPMSDNVFDQVARDYERIHNRSLPPGVRSDQFVAQRAAMLIEWIRFDYRGREFGYLDFGCGNGRLFKLLLESERLKPLFDRGHLQLFGFDTSMESLKEAEALSGEGRVCLVDDFARFPPGARFDLVTACNVFHHIPRAERAATSMRLAEWMRPGAHLVVWEHNPFNPFTRVLVELCPFDKEARLLRLSETRRLFGQSFRYLRHAYLYVFPPGLHRFGPLRRLEDRIAPLPIGAQYWVRFERNE